jgi:SP family sugar:H+ symporter-like MFS transporter
MPFLKRTEREANEAAQLEKTSSPLANPAHAGNNELSADDQKITFIAVFLGLVASIGGFMFGYTSGQISGYFQMADYQRRFGEFTDDPSKIGNNGIPYWFNVTRQGTIVSMLCAGALVGSLVVGKLADTLGRRMAVSASAFFCAIGMIIEISSTTHWAQFAVGRLVTGMGVGALSVTVPMYQSESTPAVIRGVVVACYQLFVTLGIWTAYMINYGTHNMDNSASWRITVGLGFLFTFILGGGMLFLPESPRFAFRQGREEEARATIARLGGVDTHHKSVNDQINEIRFKLDEERAGKDTKWWEMFTAPTMLRRVMIGVVLQAGQQLTGANFFFYYGTTVFQGVGLDNSYVTQIILGSVNVFCTFGGLWVVQKCARRTALIVGALWAVCCFLIYALVGELVLEKTGSSAAGNVLIVFTCLFIVSFATTWGPLVWAVVAELYPARYRAPCMALATASNWLWNFLISFFTTFIVNDIHYWYGLVFGGSCLFLAGFVFFFVIESKDRSLEEIDTMYVLGVNPITSAKWDGSKVPNDEESSRENSAAHQHASAPMDRVPTNTVHE